MLLQTSEVQIKKISEKNNEGVFEFSPLPEGFGHTLGSSLRRVLLTSLRGAAVTQVRMPNVSHQFTAIPGIKEDVVEVTLNLKGVKAKIFGENPVVGRIEKTGPGIVTAGDIQLSSDAEIVNKDHYIAELADKSSKFEADITIEPGTGYLSVEGRRSSKVGVILVDALFSPVLHVEYNVEPTRHGEITGLDKLVITVRTDGSMTPSDAVVEASTLIRNFFSRFAKGEDPVEEAEEPVSREAGAKEKSVTYIEDLSLPTRTVNALKKAGIDTLNQLGKLSDEELADIKNLGDKSIDEIQKVLKKEGLK